MARRPAKTANWQELNRKILAGLDLQSEFAALGIDFAGDSPSPDGWLECHAVGRTDQNPSAGCNVITGRYRDHGGDGLSLSFWDLAVHIRRFPRWQDARDHYAAKAGVAIDGEAGRDPAEHLAFLPWAPALIELWIRHKPGVTAEAVQAAGGRLARYRDQYTVIALPVFGPGFTAADPIGWVLYNTTGRELPIFHGRDKATGKAAKPSWAKMKTTGGSDGGLIGQHALDRLATPDADPSRQLVWKVEGPSDLLALWAAIPPDKRDRHLIVTNSGGANQTPAGWMAAALVGRTVIIVGDADTPGQAGAEKWAKWAATSAAEVRLIRPQQLGLELSQDHGQDLRDYLAAHTYADLLDAAEAAEIIEQGAATTETTATSTSTNDDNPVDSRESDDHDAVDEADDDPNRLARVNLKCYTTATGGRRLAYWKEEWYRWKHKCYRKISDKEFRAKLHASIKREFDRLARTAAAMAKDAARDGDGPPVAKKVTASLVTNVMQATSGMVCISGDVAPNTWLPTRERRTLISMANGLIDIDAILADRDDYMLENTHDWFSMASLPYDFNMAAVCPKWKAFLEHNLELDNERISVCQEWAGYLLTPSNDEQRFMILEGEGANGKSVFIAGLTAMLGIENVSNVALENFGDRFQRTDTIGKLLNAAPDCGDIDKTAEGYIKAFTAGDRMHFDRKGLPGMSVAPTARLMIACNNLPRFSDKSDGVWRRMLVVPWRVTIDAKRRIKGMDKTGWWERSGELPGIFLWALAGLARLRQQGGFTRSTVMEEALQDYKEEMNPARCFLLENVEPGPGAIRSTDLYRIYKKWAEESGYRPLGERQFGKEAKRRFPKLSRVKRGDRANRCWVYDGVQFSRDEIEGEKVNDFTMF